MRIVCERNFIKCCARTINSSIHNVFSKLIYNYNMSINIYIEFFKTLVNKIYVQFNLYKFKLTLKIEEAKNLYGNNAFNGT